MIDPLAVGILSIVISTTLIFCGLHIAVALGLISYLGALLIRGDVGVANNLLAQAAFDGIASYELAVIPLFVLMGNLMIIADIGRDTYRAANQVFHRATGGLGLATVAANALFAAVTGVTVASCVIFTKVAVPEMLRYGYKPRFATGIVAGSSVLGMLIPPSVLMVVFAMLTEASVGDLFIAGIVPGLILSGLFAAIIFVMARYMPDKAGTVRPLPGDQLMSNAETIKALLPILTLICLIIGGIYSGVFTATEAAAVGAAGAFVFALVRRKLTWGNIWQASVDTGHVTATICVIVIAATMYSRMLALSGVTGTLGTVMQATDQFYLTVALYVGVLLILGTFLDSLSTILLAVPIAAPIFLGYDANIIWLGIVTVLAVEAGVITPPLGIAIFAVKNTLEDKSITVDDVFWGSVPFLVVSLFMIALMIAFPGIVTFVF